MTPRIDYVLLGRAVEEYQRRGYVYKEVPWAVKIETIRATLPEEFPSLQLAMDEPLLGPNSVMAYGRHCHLVGSAEQGFLQMGPMPGAYVGVTPCFRHEKQTNLFYQTGFMKVELFVNLEEATVDRVLSDAQEVMAVIAGVRPDIRETEDGFDLELAEIEVGSYGERTHEKFGRWVYGTGLALPRFSVAKGLSTVLQH